MFHVKIDGIDTEFSDQKSVLNAAKAVGIDIPSLCHDDRLEEYGGCRLCIVHINKNSHPSTSCNTKIQDGMIIETDTPDLNEERKTLLKLFLKREGMDITQLDTRKDFYKLLKRFQLVPSVSKHNEMHLQTTGKHHPFINVDMTKCIDCYRCVRICAEVQGQFVWQKWNRGDRVTILADGGENLIDSSCVSCGACSDTCPTGAIEDVSVIEAGYPEQFTRSVCPYCGTGCEINIGTSGDRIVEILPVMDSPVNKGHLCVKGRYSFSFVDSHDRITEPMIKKDGQWIKVGWDEAIAFTAQNLKDISSKYGPDSVGVLGSARATNEENYLAQKFARVVIGTNNVDSCARVCHAPTAAGMGLVLGTGAATNSFDDIEKARTLILFGTNTTENHPVVGARIKQQRLRGSNLIVVDPRKTELAKLATYHLQIRPGTNIPLINAFANVIINENLVDREFIDKRVDDYDNFKKLADEWPPERAADVCGVEPETIRKAARLYAREKPSMMFHGLGITEHLQGTDGVIDLVNLALLTGNIGKAGSGVNPLRGQNNVQGSAHMGCEPSKLTGYVPVEQGRNKFEKIWKSKIPKNKGLDEIQMLDAATAGTFHALWIMGWDVYLTNPDMKFTEKAFNAMDFIIIQDFFLNETAKKFGSVFLPAVSSYEKDGTFMNSERRVQRVRKAINHRGNSKPDWEIIQLVAQKMGFTRGFDFDSPEEIWNEIRDLWSGGQGITYERIENGGLQWPCVSTDDPGTKILHVEQFTKGKRTSLVAIDYIPSTESTDQNFPILLSTGRSLFQFNASTMTDRSGNRNLRDTDYLYISKEDAVNLNLHAGDYADVESKFGKAKLKVSLDYSLVKGVAFATFNDPETRLNDVTSSNRDYKQNTPEYKVTAIRVKKHI